MVALRGSDVERVITGYPGGGAVFLIFGADRGLITERSAAIVKASVADRSDPFQLVSFHGDEIASEPGALANEWNAIGLFHDKRAIEVELGSKDITEAVRSCLDQPNPNCTMVIRGGALRRESAVRQLCERHRSAIAIECFPDSEADIAKFVRNTLETDGVSIDPAALEQLVAALGVDRAVTAGEVEKLLLYVGDIKTITAADIETIVADAAPRLGEVAVAAALSGRLPLATTEAIRAQIGGDSSQLLSTCLRAAMAGHRALAEIEAGQSKQAATEQIGRSLGPMRKYFSDIIDGRRTSAMLPVVTLTAEATARTRLEPALSDIFTIRSLWSAAQKTRRK